MRPSRRPYGLRLHVARVVLLGLCCATPVAAEPAIFDEYTLTSWTDEDGLFDGWVVGIAQDERGYMWVGTVSGLLRFDGLRFERFHPRDGDQLPQRSVTTVVTSSDGSVWVGFSGSGGVCRIRDGRVSDYGVEDGLGDGRVTALVEDADGVMLAATTDGLFRFSDGRWQPLAETNGLPPGAVHSLFRDRDGAVWASGEDTIYRRGRLESGFRPVTHVTSRALSVTESPAGEILANDLTVGVRHLTGPDAMVGPSWRHRGRGYRLLHDRRGNFWVATLGAGLWYRGAADTGFQVLGVHNGLSNDTVRALFEDRNGDVWVGTTVGLHRFARRRVRPLTDLGVVHAVLTDPVEGVWVGTAAGLIRVTDDRRQHYGVEEGLPHPTVRALHFDRSGTLWVATDGGLATLVDGRLVGRPLESGTWPTGVMAIAVAPGGDLWICAVDHGLFRWRDGSLEPVELPGEARPTDLVFADSAGRLWLVLQGGGIGLLDPRGRFDVVRQGDRFHRSELAVYEDRAGAVWFGASGRLTRMKDGVLEAITSDNGLPAGTIRAIVGDEQDHLWIGTSEGILRLAASEFDRVLADPGRRLDFRAYNSSDGLAGAPVRPGYPNAARTADGRLWFVTGNGLTMLDPGRLSATRPAPAVRIERVSAGGRAFEPDGAFTLPPGTGALQIEYTALEFFSPRQVQFRYRLEGFDDAWTDAGQRRQVSFTNLPPRRYRFRVMARSSEGVWNDHGALVDFVIEPTFYQTRAFAGLLVAGVLGLVVLGWRVRLGQIRRQFRLVLTERARMARELHDTLLQSLAGLELQVDAMAGQVTTAPDSVRQQLERVRRQIQSDVTEARQSIWDLRSPVLEARDLATALQQLGELVRAGGARFEFTVTGRPVRCAPEVEENLLRVGREAICNAARHAHASVVRLQLRYGDRTVTLCVSDDGRGFDPQEATYATGGHWGVATMRERADAIGGRLRLVSRPGAGTDLEMVAPLLAR
ncbi:MAG: two-component regulator propeller domain-containing protein [Vicinamibacterales bacterium]